MLGALAAITALVVAIVTFTRRDDGAGDARPGTVSAGPLEVGAPIASAHDTIGPDGGTIVLDEAAGDGFELEVPAGALATDTTIDVTAAPIEAIDDGPLVTPLSPLYTVHAGDVYFADLVEITVPVEVPTGWVAMGFLVDADTGRLEGMPLLRSDEHSLTVATRHFSSLFVSGVIETLLPTSVSTGFDPTADTWQFPNEGTAIAPFGHCAGMSLTEMWFFVEQHPVCDCHLRGRYDDAMAFPVGPATPSRWVDDVRGLRWATSVQKDVPWTTSAGWDVAWKAMYQLDPALQLAAFRYSMALTGEPQLVSLSTATGTPSHAIVAYAVEGDTILVADPNSPNRTDTSIEYLPSSAAFRPFVSALSSDSPSITFTAIGYAAKSALFDWDSIGRRFAEAEAGTIGMDRFATPDVVAVELTVDGIEDHRLLVDGYVPTRNPLPVYAAVTGVDGRFRTSVFLGTSDTPVATADVTMTAGSPVPTTGSYALVDVSAPVQLGVLVEESKQIGVDGSGQPVFVWRWVDFRTLGVGAPSVTSLPEATAPPETAPQVDTLPATTAVPLPPVSTFDCTSPRPTDAIGGAQWDLHCAAIGTAPPSGG